MPNKHDFSPRLLHMQQEPPSPMPRAVLLVLLLFLLSVITWSLVGRLDMVVRAEGRLLPMTQLKVVQPLEGGRVERIHVSEGQKVKQGQTLLIMDTLFSQADTTKLKQRIEETTIQIRRIEAELQNKPFKTLDGDNPSIINKVQQQYETNLNALQNELKEQKAVLTQAKQEKASAEEVLQKLKETLPIVKQSEEAMAKLQTDGYIDKLTLLDRQRERITIESDIKAQQRSINAYAARITEAENRLQRISQNRRQQLLQERAELSATHNMLEQEWLKQQHRNELMELRAPQDGYIQDLAIHTKGSVVPAGTVLMTIVPSDEPLKAEVFLNNQDIGVVAEGQLARVKLAAYEFQRYGFLDATVGIISADAVSSQDSQSQDAINYRAQLDLATQVLEQGGKTFSLRPGMLVTAEIMIGTRSVIEYLLSPIQRGLSEAATER